MRSVTWWLVLVAAVVGLVMLGSWSTAFAVEEKGEPPEAMAPAPPPPAPHIEPGRLPRVEVVFTPGVRRVGWGLVRALRCIGWTLLTIHVLLAIWVFMDIRKRGEGHGIFIALALLGGIPATILYALVRIGDKKV